MIRPYTPEDKDELVELLRLNIPAYFSASEEQDFLDYLRLHLEQYFVIEVNDLLVGAGGFNLKESGKKASISWDFIHPQFHGKGLGRELTIFRINKIKQIPGVEIIGVRTTQMAYKFYQKLGFELQEVKKDYWAEGYDLYDMRLAELLD